MTSLLADVNIQGHVDRLVRRMRSEPWLEFWDHLGLRRLEFSDLGLAPTASDAAVWQRCQDEQVFLLTNNRNDDGAESLEATIRTLNTPTSLPVFTIADAELVLTDADYADRVIDRLFRYLLEFENIRGTGRLYLP